MHWHTAPFRSLLALLHGLCLLCGVGLGACSDGGAGHPAVQAQADSLCAAAYDALYRSPREAQRLADSVLALVPHDKAHTAEALNHRMWASLLQLDWTGALATARRIDGRCLPLTERYVCCVQQMVLSSITASYQDYFDNRNKSLQLRERILEEQEGLSPHARDRLQYAQTLQRLAETLEAVHTGSNAAAMASLDTLEQLGIMRTDKPLLALYYYVRGQASLNTVADEERNIAAFDHLRQACHVSQYYQLHVLRVLSLCRLADMLCDSIAAAPVYRERAAACVSLLAASPQVIDTLRQSGRPFFTLPHLLLSQALQCCDTLQCSTLKALPLTVMCGYQAEQGLYHTALYYGAQALTAINMHHYQCYGKADSTRLVGYDTCATRRPAELQWTAGTATPTLPYLLMQLRGRLSVAYSGLGMKPQSDYNRNIYLDLLDYLRQDRSLQLSLQQEQQARHRYLYILGAVGVLLLLMLGTLPLWRRRWTRQSRGAQQALCGLDEQARHILSGDDGAVPSAPAIPELMTWVQGQGSQRVAAATQLEEVQQQTAAVRMRCEEEERQHIEARAKLSAMHVAYSLLQRLVHAVGRLQQPPAPHDLAYLRQLADKVAAISDATAQWITIGRATALEPRLERVSLQEVFALLAQSAVLYERMGVRLEVAPTTLWVMADRALTLFMLNTLVHNACKFSSSGSVVRVSAQVSPQGSVAVQVADQGVGLSPEDIHTLLHVKVYDPATVGTAAKAHKGHGFGLMNCREILERYRKEGGAFDCCRMDIQSVPGQGSTFSFFLPQAKAAPSRLYGWLWPLLALTATTSAQAATVPDSTLLQAVRYADSLYYANVEGRHDQALLWADSALHSLNATYLTQERDQLPPLTLQADGTEELLWWEADVPADYKLIMALRNEIAVAALATAHWQLYRYNNDRFTDMHHLLSQDVRLGQQMTRVQEQVRALRVAIALLVFLVLLCGVYYYILCFRLKLRHRLDLDAVRRALQELYGQCAATQADEEPRHTLQRLVQCLSRAIGQWLPSVHVEVGLCIPRGPVVYAHSDGPAIPCAQPQPDPLSPPVTGHGSLTCPLQVHLPDDTLYLGWLRVYGDVQSDAGAPACVTLLCRWLAVAVYLLLVVRRDAEEELLAASSHLSRSRYEEQRLHVQNQLLQGCLSTLKHETLYFPVRIARMAEAMAGGAADAPTTAALTEVVGYYHSLFSLLLERADSQAAADVYRCASHPAAVLLQGWVQRASARLQRRQVPVTLVAGTLPPPDTQVWCNAVLVDLLLDAVLHEWVQAIGVGLATQVTLSARVEASRCVCSLSTAVPLHAHEELAEVFLPDRRHYAYQLAKEVVGLHDRMSNYTGLRVLVSRMDDGGCTLRFDLPLPAAPLSNECSTEEISA